MSAHQRLVWFDLETTGLNPRVNSILEVAATTSGVNAFERVIHHEQHVLNGMNDWCRNQHAITGLSEDVLDSKHGILSVEDDLIQWLGDSGVKKGEGVIAGNSIHFDRAFVKEHMPLLDSYLHYRMLDVSSIRAMVLRTLPEEHHVRIHAQECADHKHAHHRAMRDVRASIAEATMYFQLLSPAWESYT